MRKLNKNFMPLDKFIDLALYNKKNGFYMKKNPIGKIGDFITAPNISILFSEMIAIWIIAFWKYLNFPKKINLVDLGGGNGEMIFQMLKTFNNFPKFKNSNKIYIFEKSPFLIKVQKKKLRQQKVFWINDINNIEKNPTIYLANEFFDALPVKQFFKKKRNWYERYVKVAKKNKYHYLDFKTNIKKLEKKIGINISKNQKTIEFSPLTLNYLIKISKKINSNTGGLLIIDYGYIKNSMKNSLQAVFRHKKTDVLDNFSNSDITHEINFNLIKKIVKMNNLKSSKIISQSNFLCNLGILKRAEIISKNISFTKKINIYYRLKRLIDKKYMGELFKVIFITNNNIKFNEGFKSN